MRGVKSKTARPPCRSKNLSKARAKRPKPGPKPGPDRRRFQTRSSLEPPVAGMYWEPDTDGVDEPAHREEIEAAEERQVDGILSRLHAHGMDSLTADEHALLGRVSARYRSRLGKRT